MLDSPPLLSSPASRGRNDSEKSKKPEINLSVRNEKIVAIYLFSYNNTKTKFMKFIRKTKKVILTILSKYIYIYVYIDVVNINGSDATNESN